MTAKDVHTLEAERLTERISVLESRRASLMAAVRHTQDGRLDDSYLDDVLRAELTDIPQGVLLETIEAEIKCLRRRLAELEGNLTDPTAAALAHWQEIDREVNAGALRPEDASAAVIDAGLARRVLGPGSADSIEALSVIEPDRGDNLVPGPLLLVAFEGGGLGGPRIYRPVSDELRWDTGLFS